MRKGINYAYTLHNTTHNSALTSTPLKPDTRRRKNNWEKHLIILDAAVECTHTHTNTHRLVRVCL